MKQILKQEGFSLIELLIALTILAIGLLGVLGMHVYAIRGNAFASNMTIAEKLAEQKLEYLRNFAYGPAKGINFGTEYADQDSVPITDLPAADRLTPGANDTVFVDVEGYSNLRATHTGTVLNDLNSDGIPDPPFDRFRRVTIQKIINGSPTDGIPDCSMVIRVLVYWRGPEGSEHKVTMMTMKSLGG